MLKYVRLVTIVRKRFTRLFHVPSKLSVLLLAVKNLVTANNVPTAEFVTKKDELKMGKFVTLAFFVKAMNLRFRVQLDTIVPMIEHQVTKKKSARLGTGQIEKGWSGYKTATCVLKANTVPTMLNHMLNLQSWLLVKLELSDPKEVLQRFLASVGSNVRLMACQLQSSAS